MQAYFLPILLIVCSNVAYNLITKSTPSGVNPFFSLVITYLVGAAASALLYFATAKGETVVMSFSKINFTSFILGLAIIGLEAGYLVLYRSGCPVSMGSLVSNIILAVVLLGIGLIFYKESINWKQIAGVLLCIGGIVLINLK